MRILFSLIAAAGLALTALTGCSGGSGSSTQASTAPGAIKIGFLVKQPDQTWFQNEWKFAQQAADKDGFTLIKIGVPDPNATLAAIDNLAAQGAQGFIICTPDVKLGQAILDRAQRANMKVMSVDDQFQTPDGKPMTDVHHMGISAKDIGKIVGTALAAEMKKRNWSPNDTAAAILTHDQFDTHRDRTDGAIEGLTAAGFPKDHIYKSPLKDTTIENGRDAMNALLTQHQEVKHWLIASINDETVLGGVRATENRGIAAADVAGIGIGADAGRTDLGAAQPTGFIASVLISPKRHGYETADLMYHWIKDGVAPPMATWTQGILVNRDNFKQVIKEQGLE
ncbi:MAG TPA: arabinose ABC transporter substrate-binding protein [Phycisphaerae bacterium]|nr:arabinose ABC transporter substrate-binding protein [Phycisphaerae bacterium]